MEVFKLKVPKSLVGKTIAESSIRKNTGCTVIALNINHEFEVNPDPNKPIPQDAELVLIGSTENEDSFLDEYVKDDTYA